ncbi:MAG: PH domain-containing protein [Clostridiales bacterium]|nr:PH domain-containing protein [Clostridiales bacterium]
MASKKPDRLSQYIDNEPLLWKDRKRILGLPISFTRYSFDQNKFYLKIGLFNIRKDELLLYRVLDVKVNRTFGQRIFGVGTVTLLTADQSTPNLEIKNIKDCERVAKALSNIVEKERDEKRVLGKEMFGAAGLVDTEGVEHPIDTMI